MRSMVEGALGIVASVTDEANLTARAPSTTLLRRVVPFPAIAGQDDLFLAAAGGRRQAEVEIAGFKRVFVVAQGRIVRRHRNAEACGQRRLDQARALELVEAGQIVERLQPEMGQK